MTDKPKDVWDRSLMAAQIIGYVCTPLIVLLIGAYLTHIQSKAAKERELAVQELNQALSVLNNRDDNATRKKVYDWAIATFERRIAESRIEARQGAKDAMVHEAIRKYADKLCYRPTDQLMERPPALKQITEGEDLVLVLIQHRYQLASVTDHLNRLIDLLEIGCGYLSKTPEQISADIEARETRRKLREQ